MGDGLYEYRGSRSTKGTIRMYFCYSEDTMIILDAEYKTSLNNLIDRARNRMKEMMAL